MPGYWAELPARDRAMYERCQRIMSERLCGRQDSPRNEGAALVQGFAQSQCEGEQINAEDYAYTPPTGRKQWLQARGCPKDMLDAM